MYPCALNLLKTIDCDLHVHCEYMMATIKKRGYLESYLNFGFSNIEDNKTAMCPLFESVSC